jgi:hypothetical protein
VIPGCGCLSIGNRPPPFIPRKKREPRTVAEVRRHGLGVPTQSHCCCRTDMEALTDCTVRFRDRELERLRNVISVHVMYCFHTEIRKDQLLTIRELSEHPGIEVSSGVEWSPARTDDVPGMENRRSNYFPARRLQQPFFDRSLFDSVVAKRLARLRLRRRDNGAVPVNPDSSAMKEQRITFLKRLNEMLLTFQCEANEIYDDVRTEGCNAISECAGRFFCRAIDRHSLHFSPGAVGLIRFARSATNGDYLVSGGNEPWNQEGADVAGSADDDDSNGRWGWSRWLGLSGRNLFSASAGSRFAISFVQ